VGHGVGEVDQERAVLVLLDELNGVLGVPGRQVRLVLAVTLGLTIFSPSIKGSGGKSLLVG